MMNSTDPIDLMTVKFDLSTAKRNPYLGIVRVVNREWFKADSLRATPKEIAILDDAARTRWPFSLLWSIDYVNEKTKAAFQITFGAKSMRALPTPNDCLSGVSVWEHIHKGCIPHVQEGEFKTLAMVESGYVAVGVGGISSCIRAGGKELVRGLKDIIETSKPKALAFVGDADTSLIPDFAKAMLRLAIHISPLPLLLPRLPVFSVGKGVDDIRAVLGDKFNAWFDSLKVITVDPKASAFSLAMTMLRPELDNLKALSANTAVTREDAMERIVKLAAGFHEEGAALAEISGIACEIFGFEATEFAALVAVKASENKEKWEKRKRGLAAERGDKQKGLPSAPEAPVINTGSLMERVNSRMYSDATVMPEPVPRYHLGGVPICTPGNLTTISAQAKTGKSSGIYAAIGSSFATDVADCLGFTSKNPDGWAVVHLDTEQCPYRHMVGIRKKTIRRAGAEKCPTWLRSFCLTGFSAAEIRAALRPILEEAKTACGGIHSVVIDGTADMAVNVNDPEECDPLIAWIHGLAIEFYTPILNVIHMNPGKNLEDKTRGHLGSQLERKSETNLKMKKDANGVTVMFADRNREAPIPEKTGPRFAWDDKLKMHVSVNSAGAPPQASKVSKMDHFVTKVTSSQSFKPGTYKSRKLKDLISSVTGVEVRHAANIITRLVETGAASSISYGTYEVPKPKGSQ